MASLYGYLFDLASIENNCYLFATFRRIFRAMPRLKLPEGQVKETVGVKLPPAIIDELSEIGAAWDMKPGTVGRELLLLGLAFVRSTRQDDLPMGLTLALKGAVRPAPTHKIKQ